MAGLFVARIIVNNEVLFVISLKIEKYLNKNYVNTIRFSSVLHYQSAISLYRIE